MHGSHDWHQESQRFLNENPTPAHFIPKEDPGVAFRHSGWKTDRARVDAALAQAKTVTEKRLTAFRNCGSYCCVQYRLLGHKQNPIKEFRMTSMRCRDRWCVPCAAARAADVRDGLLRQCHDRRKARNNLSLITLTLRATAEPLSARLTKLIDAFRELRKQKCWKKSIAGGAAVIEVKLGEQGQWHCHYHIVAEASYLDQKQLSETWLKVTGDSYIVDIRRMGNMGSGASYVTKYITKACSASILRDPARLAEAIDALHGRRLVSTFGTWRKIDLHALPEILNEPAPWHHLCTLEELLRDARAREPAALRILAKLRPFRLEPPDST